jgi:hypothetical protein
VIDLLIKKSAIIDTYSLHGNIICTELGFFCINNPNIDIINALLKNGARVDSYVIEDNGQAQPLITFLNKNNADIKILDCLNEHRQMNKGEAITHTQQASKRANAKSLPSTKNERPNYTPD